MPPGTTVDQGIVHPFENDWYTVSQYGALGTAKPAHYHVLCDDHGWDADSVQTITYHMCYACVRAAQSISIPAPAYYAHLVAERAKCYYDIEEEQYFLFLSPDTFLVAFVT